MQLTAEEMAALERYRLRHERKLYPEYVDDLKLLADLAERDRPVRTYGDLTIRWDGPVTPERLVACGFTREAIWLCHGDIDYECVNGRAISMRYLGSHIHDRLAPRNMGEVWQLMERCGITQEPPQPPPPSPQ